MGNNRMTKMFNVSDFVYKIFLILSFLYCIFSGATFFMEENYDELCDMVSLGEFYHFLINEKTGCNIRWEYLFREYVFILFVMFSPFLIFLYSVRLYFKKLAEKVL